MKKRSKEHDEMLQMEKVTKTALKIRGINGDHRINHCLWKRWGLGVLEKHGMQGFPAPTLLQRVLLVLRLWVLFLQNNQEWV